MSRQVSQQTGGAILALLVLGVLLSALLLLGLSLSAESSVKAGGPSSTRFAEAVSGPLVQPLGSDRSLDGDWDPRSRREQALAAKLAHLLSPFFAADEFRIAVHDGPLLGGALASQQQPAEASAAEAALPGDGSTGREGDAQPQQSSPLQVILLVNRPAIDGQFELLLRQILLPALGLGPEQAGALRVIAHPFSGPPGSADADTTGSVAAMSADAIRQWPARLGVGLSLVVGHLLPWLPVLLTLLLAVVLVALVAVVIGRVRQRGALPNGVSATQSLGELRRISREEPRRIANVLSQWMEQDER
ncbi:hypothetical protein NCG89_16675 [Spongiibacter taiwanensis]|uniref:hypothetical protein n=1 Tax=Spongiibacter taiwanensis TaxID=1748242 RepID=UPI002034CF90|nr:hypothetical protein [Spongiibacter taiwanensis]USA43158.1 hypothetical protein NCG89_16675 [Spongiibacter taiwanensis]